jgi:hypothetical protein
MAVATSEYHPYGACLMFKACNDSDIVRANLAAICDWAKMGANNSALLQRRR